MWMEKNLPLTLQDTHTFKWIIMLSKLKTSRDYLTIPEIPDTVWTNPWHFIAFGFGSGVIPFAPGTFGTLITIPIYLVLSSFSVFFYLVFTICFTIFGIWLSEKVSRDIKVHDHQGMNIDEIVGFLVTMIAAPHGWRWILLGVILFRIFDIWKPFPIRLIDEKMPGGAGVIMDDVLAGIYSFIIIQLIAWVLR